MIRWPVVLSLICLTAVSPVSSMAADSRARAEAPVRPDYGNIYFGVDVDTNGNLAGYAGVLVAPFGLHQSGLRISAFAMPGQYEYVSGPIPIEARFATVDLLVGWSHLFGYGGVTLMVGGNYQDHRPSTFDPTNTVEGTELGFKVQGDVWINPTPATLLFALASYSTAFDSYYAIGRAGYDITGGSYVFVGPEVSGFSSDRTEHIRLGAHVTGIKLGPAKLSFAGGWLTERDEGSGGYATATVDFSF